MLWPVLTKGRSVLKFPDDPNGDVLRSMYDSGMDLSVPHDIEFFHEFSDLATASAMAEHVKKNMKVSNIEVDANDNDGWDVVCIIKLIPTHQGITSLELALKKIAEENGGSAEGWGVMQE